MFPHEDRGVHDIYNFLSPYLRNATYQIWYRKILTDANVNSMHKLSQLLNSPKNAFRFFSLFNSILEINVLYAEKQIYNNNQQINILLIEIDHNPLQEIRVPTMKFKLDVQRKGKT